MRLITGFIFSCFLLGSGWLLAQQEGEPKQEPETKATRKAPPKPPKDFRPTGIRIGTDLISLIKSNTQKNFTGWELNADVDFANYFLTLDMGNWGRDFTLPNGAYTNGGTYYRIGVDINLLQKDPDHNMFFIGLRYGHSSFHETLSYQETQPIFGTFLFTNTNPSVSGSWGEITTGLRVKVWKGFWMGYTARMKIAASTSGSIASMSPYDMPGYGPVQQAPWWGFNYQVFWKFPIRKEKAPSLLKQ